MRNKGRTFLCLAMLSSIVLTAFVPQETEKEPEVVLPESGSFIRMDLLKEEKADLPPPRRNIFTAGRAENREPDDTFFGEPIAAPGEKPTTNIEPSLPTLDLRYIGYVRSEEKMVALVIFEGEALAVAEGEEMDAGIFVSKILPDEIEIAGPDANPSKFSLEGEQP